MLELRTVPCPRQQERELSCWNFTFMYYQDLLCCIFLIYQLKLRFQPFDTPCSFVMVRLHPVNSSWCRQAEMNRPEILLLLSALKVPAVNGVKRVVNFINYFLEQWFMWAFINVDSQSSLISATTSYLKLVPCQFECPYAGLPRFSEWTHHLNTALCRQQ